jgi:cell division protein FtsB
MQRKHKMTGCARLFLVLLIIAPLAYLGAAYYNGQDGIQSIKNLLGIGERKSDSGETYDKTSGDLQESLTAKDQTIRKLHQEISELKKENAALKEEVARLKEDQSQ